MPNPYMPGTKLTKVVPKPQKPLSLQQVITIIKKLAHNGRAPITLKIDIYNPEEIDVILMGLPLLEDDFIET